MSIIPDLSAGLTRLLGLGGPASRSSYDRSTDEALIFSSELREAAAQQRNLLGEFNPGPVFLQPVVMGLNPRIMRFTQPKRWTKVDVRNGSVFYHFLNRKRQDLDIMTLYLEGNTGDITSDPVIDPETGDRSVVGAGNLLAWHSLALLTREPEQLADGRENTRHITLMTPAIPTAITFYGFFNTALPVEFLADRPNSLNYTLEFTVTKTNPDMDLLLSQITDVLQSRIPGYATPATSPSGGAAP